MAVGKSVPLIDAWEKVAGTAKYTTDLKQAGMLYGKILRSPYHHARVLNVDASLAERLPGVKAVLTPKDIKPVRYGFMARADQYALPIEKVRYRGEDVAAVAAVDEDTAQEALSLIKVEYEELPSIFSAEEALLEGAPLVHDDAPGNLVSRVFLDKGDVDAAFASADCVVEGRFTSQRVHQAYLEPAGCLTIWDQSNKVTVWTGSMNNSGIRAMLAQALDLPVSRVRAIQPHVGGSFGVKVRLWPFYPISAYLSRKAGGRPVRIIFSREEEYFAGRPREATVIYLKTAAKKDGTLLGRQVRLIYDNGAYSEEGPQMMKNMCYRSDSLYRLPSTRVEAIGAYTTTTPIGAFRPWGNLQMTFALESQMDSIANELGIDPVELRIKNASRAGDVSVHGWRLDSCGLVECLDKTVQAMDWQKRRANCQPLHGIGVAAGIHTGDWRYLGANFSGSNASVEVQEDGRITVVSGEAEFGQGSHTTFAQIAAEVLQVPMEHIEVTYPDTDRTPFALGPWGTRVTIGGGWAVKLAAEDARSKLLEAAADLLEANPNDLDISEGKISVKGTDSRALSFGDVAKYALYRANGGLITGRGTHDPKTDPPDPTKQTSPCLAWSFASCIAEIEIDRKTGQVNILDMASCTDGGTIINPLNASGQAQGQILEAIGFALYEEMKYEKGYLLTPGLMAAGTPRVFQMPRLKVMFADTYDPNCPFGAKGLAEVAGPAAFGAVVNAITHATGLKFTDLPITPEKILRAIEMREQGAESK